ncbi:hypothetical protein [Halobacterium sp. KA-4]|nr:hypothetical protein [Halobacterium sp. KA-4]
MGVLAVATSLWFEFYIPLAVLIVGNVVYVGYHFLQDVSIFLDFLERLRN